MLSRTIELANCSLKSYKKSNKCEMVFTPIGWNILDDEQRKDLEFVLDAPSRAGRIRECVRRVRMAMERSPIVYYTPPSQPTNKHDVDDVSDDDILKSLL